MKTLGEVFGILLVLLGLFCSIAWIFPEIDIELAWEILLTLVGPFLFYVGLIFNKMIKFGVKAFSIWGLSLAFTFSAGFSVLLNYHVEHSQVKENRKNHQNLKEEDLKGTTGNTFEGIQQKMAQQGDYFGGALGAIFGFITIFLLVIQNIEQGKREEARDYFDFYSKQIESLEKKISGLYHSETGENSRVEFSGLQALIKFRSSSPTNEDLNNFGGHLLSLVNLYEEILYQSLIEIKEAHHHGTKGRIDIVSKKYEMLKSHVPGYIANEMYRAREHYLGHLIFDNLFKDKTLAGLKVYFFINQNVYNYPDINSIHEIESILNPGRVVNQSNS